MSFGRDDTAAKGVLVAIAKIVIHALEPRRLSIGAKHDHVFSPSRAIALYDLVSDGFVLFDIPHGNVPLIDFVITLLYPRGKTNMPKNALFSHAKTMENAVGNLLRNAASVHLTKAGKGKLEIHTRYILCKATHKGVTCVP